jgi:hypothetical protein
MPLDINMNVDFTNINEEDTNVNHFYLNHPSCLDELQFDLNYPLALMMITLVKVYHVLMRGKLIVSQTNHEACLFKVNLIVSQTGHQTCLLKVKLSLFKVKLIVSQQISHQASLFKKMLTILIFC